jgi:serine/threonine-protein kinase
MSRPAKTTAPTAPSSASSSTAPRGAAASEAGALARLAPLWPGLLLALGLAEVALSIYQWSELLTLRSGGATSCGISETVNCETVWNSGFASRMHGLTGLPVAGLGVVWGLAAALVAGALLLALRRGGPLRALAGAVKLVAAAGFLSCVTFAVASAQARALCPTCLATYALVGGFALLAFLKVPGPLLPAGEAGKALGWAALPAAGFFALALAAGPSTPKADAGGVSALRGMPAPSAPATPPPSAPAQPSRPLTPSEQQAASFIQGLPPEQQQALADALAAYRAQPAQATGGYGTRRTAGDAGAPLKMVEWTDTLCGHCASLAETVKELKRVVPPGLLSIEARQFPLAKTCNAQVGGDFGGDVRCASARAQICLQETGGYWDARDKLFAEQRTLTVDRVMEIASGAGMDRSKLQACIASPQTQAKLDEDIRFGLAFRLEGTPLVVLNGRKAAPYGPLIYALALARGDASSPAFASLPAPRMGGHGEHDGHGH